MQYAQYFKNLYVNIFNMTTKKNSITTIFFKSKIKKLTKLKLFTLFFNCFTLRKTILINAIQDINECFHVYVLCKIEFIEIQRIMLVKAASI